MGPRRKEMMYAYKDWLRKLDQGMNVQEARLEIERDYQLTGVEKAGLSLPMQIELEMREEHKKWSTSKM